MAVPSRRHAAGLQRNREAHSRIAVERAEGRPPLPPARLIDNRAAMTAFTARQEREFQATYLDPPWREEVAD